MPTNIIPDSSSFWSFWKTKVEVGHVKLVSLRFLPIKYPVTIIEVVIYSVPCTCPAHHFEEAPAAFLFAFFHCFNMFANEILTETRSVKLDHAESYLNDYTGLCRKSQKCLTRPWDYNVGKFHCNTHCNSKRSLVAHD